MTPTEQAALIERWLRVFAAPGQVVELRALGVQGKRAVCEVHGDLSALARRAVELDRAGAMGCYFTPNPLRPDLAEWKNSRIKAADVTERRWLLIDVDPARPAGISSSSEELKAAWIVLDRCRATLSAVGMVNPVVGCSGNGWHLSYPVQYPNDSASHEKFKAVLKLLQERCGDSVSKEEDAALKVGNVLPVPKARVGIECHDAPRIWKLYGTHARKGTNTPERPHRMAFLVEGGA